MFYTKIYLKTELDSISSTCDVFVEWHVVERIYWLSWIAHEERVYVVGWQMSWRVETIWQVVSHVFNEHCIISCNHLAVIYNSANSFNASCSSAVSSCSCSKGSAPYWSNPLFLIFDTGAQSTSTRAPECQKINKSSPGDEIPERDVTYHLIWLLTYHWTTTHPYFQNIF